MGQDLHRPADEPSAIIAPVTVEPAMRVSRVSWGAIIAGTVVAVVMMTMLNLLGLGLGMLSINPAEEAQPLAGLGTGAIIWWIATWLVALFVSGMIAGRLAGRAHRGGGALHGLVTWGLASLAVLWLVSTGVSSVVSASVQTTRQVLDLAARGATAAAVGVSEAAGGLDERTRDELRTRARTTLSDAGLPPDLADVQMAGVENALESLLRVALDPSRDLDRQTIVATIVRETTLSPAESEQLASAWEGEMRNAEQALPGLEQRVERVAGDVADAVGTVALVTFAVLLIGALAAAWGGWVGTPRRHWPIAAA